MYKIKNIDDYKLIIKLHNENGIFCFSAKLYKDNILVDYEHTNGITDKCERAEEILNILADNNVFPRHLHNVIDELYINVY